MKTYRGIRNRDGFLSAFVVTETVGVPRAYPLQTGHEDVEVGHPGRGPDVLAVGILRDHFAGDEAKVAQYAEEFRVHYIEEIPQWLTRFEFTTAELDKMIEAIDERLGFEAKDQEELGW